MARFARKLKRSLYGSDMQEALDSYKSLAEYKEQLRRNWKKARNYQEKMKTARKVNYNTTDEILNIANNQLTTPNLLLDDADDVDEEILDKDEEETIDIGNSEDLLITNNEKTIQDV